MSQKSENPEALAGATGPGDGSLPGGENVPTLSESARQKQETIRALRREFEIEAARVKAISALRAMSVKATHAADNLALLDDVGATREFDWAADFGREARFALRLMGGDDDRLSAIRQSEDGQ